MRRPATLSALALAAACSSAPDHREPTEVAAWQCSPRLELSRVWAFLADKYDRDQDGAVTLEEYGRGEVQFDNYDRDGDGVLRERDFPDDTFFNGFSHMILGRADGDGDERVTRAEWDAFGAELDGDQDGEMTPAEVAAVMGSWAEDWRLFLLSFDQDSDRRFDATDLDLTFRDQDFDGDGVLAGREMQGWQPPTDRAGPGPAPGEPAPDFTLGFAGEPERTFHLAERAGARPVALVFGSYT